MVLVSIPAQREVGKYYPTFVHSWSSNSCWKLIKFGRYFSWSCGRFMGFTRFGRKTNGWKRTKYARLCPNRKVSFCLKWKITTNTITQGDYHTSPVRCHKEDSQIEDLHTDNSFILMYDTDWPTEELFHLKHPYGYCVPSWGNDG